MTEKQDLPILAFPSQAAFENWLEAEHEAVPGLWLKIAKKESGIASVSYAEALDVALCFGWIDGQKRTFDAEHWLQRFTPRTARSRWSQVNRVRADELVAAGMMRRAGLAQIEAARADGRWEAAYAPQKTAEVPDDLRAALDADPAAAAFFATLDSRNRFAILHRVGDAKKAATRAARIEKFVAMLRENKKIYP
ncbi:YdeI/OmpD-associated family protein [Nonomuraea montanisoli]|uniref:YdeI/OmpD-associated family protein n=1 Tax=Nonomuraea montanisoli TaxID=2741721 RepID=UPI002E2CBC43|nr:YdeI/OmpD-associated family protein [Nonomuraea montanisoli]